MKKQFILVLALLVTLIASPASADSNVITKQVVSKYIYEAMVRWVPLANHIQREHNGKYIRDERGLFITEPEAEVRARYEATASDIVDVAFDDNNPALFRGEDGRLKTALQLAAIASFEGGFQKFVEDGDCNKPGFKIDGAGGCDGGAAFSNWQIHIWGGGYLIKDNELTQVQYARDYAKDHPDEIIKGDNLISDHRLAAQVAYYLIRYSLRNYHTLCSYTGESCDGNHRLATQRSDRAISYLRAHPFVPPASDELAVETIGLYAPDHI